MENFDHCIIGAGVVGLAIAFKLSQRLPETKILLIESHHQFGTETSSRNSEVIHAGIYYPENSLKAELCLSGAKQLYQFCQDYAVPYQRIGKLIIANDDSDIEELERIQSNAHKNNVRLNLLNQKECHNLEPNVRAKVALISPNTGIIDSHQYMQTLLTLAEQQGVLYSPNTQFLDAEENTQGFNVRVNTADGPFSFTCQQLINSAGLHAPEVAKNSDSLRSLIPEYHLCRGQYYSYQDKAPFSHLIYPIPKKNNAGLGIHATLDLSGQVKFGPDIEFIKTLDYSFNESRKKHFIQAIKRYFPHFDSGKLIPSYCGIRPKLTGPNESAADFIIQTFKEHNVLGLINLFGIESPGLTSSLAIADSVVDTIIET
jgi:L-2-hydroxyglutarate oxidase LhgO